MSGPAGQEFGRDEAREWIAVPTPDDDKYSRGVLGFVTGSARYPGAAVLGVEAALHTGVGMVRYLGPGRPTRLVLARRPEAVTTDGRVQAWVLGSGLDASERDAATGVLLATALGQDVPLVIDSGALDQVSRATGPAVLTPHAGELANLLGVDRAAVTADPAGSALRAATDLQTTVLLKGHTSYVATPDGSWTGFTAVAVNDTRHQGFTPYRACPTCAGALARGCLDLADLGHDLSLQGKWGPPVAPDGGPRKCWPGYSGGWGRAQRVLIRPFLERILGQVRLPLSLRHRART